MAKLTPIKAIRAKCLDCCCGSFLEVKLCENEECALHEYRFGKRPKKDGTETSDEILEEDTEE